MEEQAKAAIKCGNPACGKQFKFNKPGKPGKYGIKCPYCQTKNLFDIPAEPQTPQDTESPEEKAAREQKEREEQMLRCETFGCRGHVIKTAEHQDGTYFTECDTCQAGYKILVENGKLIKASMVTPPPVQAEKTSPMKLVVSKFFSKEEYRLTHGSHTIGRLDDSRPSDFMVKDKFASAKSLRIDVILEGRELKYKLNVLKATNPVYHNNRQLHEGDALFLDYNDTLKIGKTLIKVQKCE